LNILTFWLNGDNSLGTLKLVNPPNK